MDDATIREIVESKEDEIIFRLAFSTDLKSTKMLLKKFCQLVLEHFILTGELESDPTVHFARPDKIRRRARLL